MDSDKKSKQHVQLPNNMTISGELNPKDLLVYVTIKRFMNSVTKECFPSLDTIVKLSGVSKPTVRKSIETLKLTGYLEVRLDGRRNVYKFNSYKTFEPFSYDFLDLKDIDSNTKAYMIASQQIMFKDQEGYGKISYSDSELAKMINIDRHTIAKYNKKLEEMGYLSIISTDKKDKITGLKIEEKIFHLNELGQAVVWALQKHEEDINELKEKQEETSKDIKFILEKLDEIKKDNEEVKKINKIQSELLKQNNIDTSFINDEIKF